MRHSRVEDRPRRISEGRQDELKQYLEIWIIYNRTGLDSEPPASLLELKPTPGAEAGGVPFSRSERRAPADRHTRRQAQQIHFGSELLAQTANGRGKEHGLVIRMRSNEKNSLQMARQW